MTIAPTITSVRFSEYKALKDFHVSIGSMNILVGPNNNGKSTVIGAFRILAQALRVARTRQPEFLWGATVQRPAWRISEDLIPVSSENIHTNYADVHTTVVFRLSNDVTLTLFFPDEGGCKFYADNPDGYIRTSAQIRGQAGVSLSIIPVLGPLEHDEPLVSEDTVRRNLLTTRASRHFRNYWYHYPDGFDQFSDLVQRTWPGMEVAKPERIGSTISMFCREHRMDRELYWAGFGFQIWLQLLAHISRARESTLLVVDEPELYLHPDIQIKLLSILREAGPDIIIATHSSEIMSEADPAEIMLVDKTKRSSERLKNVEGVQKALDSIGSIQNITLTRLARNRRILFTEGATDIRIIRRFAERLGMPDVASGSDLTFMESGGFSFWERVKGMAAAFREALDFKLHIGSIFDRDYWCEEEIDEIYEALRQHLEFAYIHPAKEIENYLLVPSAIDRAMRSAISERRRRTGEVSPEPPLASDLIDEICDSLKLDIQSQYISKRLAYYSGGKLDVSTITKTAIDRFERKWNDKAQRLLIVPGKRVLRSLRETFRTRCQTNPSDYQIVAAMRLDEIPADMRTLLRDLEHFRA